MSTDALVAAALAGDRRALARLLSLLEGGGPAAAAALRALYPRGGRAHIVGLTGPAGSGKSTLIAALARQYRERGEPVGVLAIDPTSPYTGGALLGDRVRMQALAGDAGVFVRSMAVRHGHGGLALAADAACAALDAAGYTRILLETVGAGQDEVAVAGVAHTVVVVSAPGLGDEVQALKAGLLEIGDVLVVNKADRPDAEAAAAALHLLQALAPAPPWAPPIVKTCALRGEGIADLVEAIERHRAFLAASDAGGARARQRARAAALAAASAELDRRLHAAASAPCREALWEAVATRARTPLDAADALVRAVLASPPVEEPSA
ncbi:MAG TPA: methylmalonyl Co-A mutase-associated GTPase MeaB [Chloroflexota bacterium]|jgi:LAO/AO transport system kinase|nr:methylmalonyl Co-A mutase-associated GTPase MeaB [Chloroflexota bacterium]